MPLKETTPIKGSDAVPEARVTIVGSNLLQNELLAQFVEKETGIPCKTCRLVDLAAVSDDNPAGKHLILMDCLEIDIFQIWSGLATVNSPDISRNYTALFNIDPEAGLETEAMARGVRGIFYRHDPHNMFPRGISEMLKGELWYARKIMSRFLLQKRSMGQVPKDTSNTLTFREREILIGIAAGASNKEIAQKFNISIHTVKTHVYNIYKKINVPNRLQAALWAAQYL